jgi:hypothetical protein
MPATYQTELPQKRGNRVQVRFSASGAEVNVPLPFAPNGQLTPATSQQLILSSFHLVNPGTSAVTLTLHSMTAANSPTHSIPYTLPPGSIFSSDETGPPFAAKPGERLGVTTTGAVECNLQVLTDYPL